MSSMGCRFGLLCWLFGACPALAAVADQAPTVSWAQLPLGYRPGAETDEGGLWMISDKAEEQLRTSPLLVKDAAINTYLSKVVCKLSGPYCASIRIYVLDLPYFNAAMAPNGMLQVWTGLLLSAHNEAQLSFVLGHEISHYLLKHTITQYRRIRDRSGAIAVLGALTGGIGNLAALSLPGSLNAFSRDEEREADKRGFELATSAGYDPSQAVSLWQEVLDLEGAAVKDKDLAVFAQNHPPTAERLVAMTSMASAVQPQRAVWETGIEGYRAVTRSFRTQWLAENLAMAHFDESLALLQPLLKAEPGSGELQFYLGEVYRRRNSDGDSAKALSAYAAAIAGADAPKQVYRGLGLASMKAGDKAGAREAFQRYLVAAPQADDRAMIESYLSQL